MNKIITLSFILLSQILFSQAKKDKLIEMMHDSDINFYQVCIYVENYFKDIDKGKKGSGWKPFQRWKFENESKFYPSGNRSDVDFSKARKNFERIKQNSNLNNKTSLTSGWDELGPNSTGEITGHYSFGIGRIVSFYINPGNTNIMYLGSRTGGFWKTTDGGTNWTGGVTDFLPAAGVNSIGVKPSDSNEVLINVNNSRNHYSHGVYRSNDGGDTFAQSKFNPTNLGWGGLGSSGQIYKIKYHPTIPDLVFIGTRSGLYRSTDDLLTTNWTVPVSGDDFTDIDFHPTDPNIVYAYAKNQPNVIYVSTNVGASFTTVSIAGNSNAVGTVQVSASNEDSVYYFSSNGYWKSTDKGVSFTQISTPSLSDAGFAVSDIDDNNILAGYVDAFFSTDGGNNFNQVTYWSLGNTNGAGSGHQNSFNTSTDYIHADLQAAECINGIFYACTDGFLVKSTDNGQNWDILSENGVGIRMNYNLGVSQSNHKRTIAGSQDNGTSIQTENGWVEMYGADGMEGLIHPLNDDWMIGSFQNGGRRRTKDAGQTSDRVTPDNQNGYWIAPLFYDPNDQMTVYHLGENVYKSTDFGDSWTQLGTPNFSGTIQYATIAENNSNLIIATQYSSIELSTDGGNTFTSIRGTLPNSSITDVTFDPNNDDTIIVTYGSYQDNGNKIYVSHDQGSTWSNITHNLTDMPIRSVVIDETNNSNIYVGAEIGVYKMPMNGSNWSLYSNDLPNVSVLELEIMKGSNTLKASTWGRGLWEFPIDGRASYPKIVKTSITHLPTNTHPKVDTDQYVISDILYSNTLTSVTLKWSLDTPIFDNSITMTNVSGTTWKSETPIPNYPVGTKIYFKVVAEGNTSDITETYKFMYTVREGGFCDALGSSVSGNLFLNQVSIENINNSSINDMYTYYSSEVVNLIAGNTYTITLNANTNWGSNDFGAWIDYDNDTDFEESELILSDLNSGSSGTASFTVPANAVLTENVRMRIRLGYWDSPILDPCGETLGEVEDYLVNITGNPLAVESAGFFSNMKILPNPTSGLFTIDFGKKYNNIVVFVSNALGQEISSTPYDEVEKAQIEIKAGAGLYFVKIKSISDNVFSVVKIIKQ